MSLNKKNRWVKTIILAGKIAIGSCIAMDIAGWLGLDFAASAGIITLLTIVNTKWETLRLSFSRFVSFLITVFVSWIIFQTIPIDWLAFGLFVFIIFIVFEAIGWKATISVNAVIGTHFLATRDFSVAFIMNEFLLVFIGITIAILLNLFQNNETQKACIIHHIQFTESQLQIILEELACYLDNKPMNDNVWDRIIALEKNLDFFMEGAYEYQNNTFAAHTDYYVKYFEMRLKQCNILHNLHYEIQKIRQLPQQAKIISSYILYLKKHVREMNDPKEQIQRLENLCENMKKEELPTSREEFESRAKLYHILMDLEEFLIFKRRFIEAMDKKQFQIYWNKEIGDK